ncbi:MAG: hypothetical protein ACKPKO_17625 [Candidatus Fonsibacter sp.]
MPESTLSAAEIREARFPTLAHAHLGVLGREVGCAGLALSVHARVQVAKVYDIVDALELCSAHRFVVAGRLLSELHCRMDAGGLVAMSDARAGATQHLCAPLSKTSTGDPASMSRAIVAMTACIISSGLMASNAPRLSNWRSPGFNEI